MLVLAFFANSKPAQGQCGGCQNASFGPALQRVGYEEVQYGFAVADFDQDGLLDVALPGYGSLAIHFGDGRGGFDRVAIVGEGQIQYPSGVVTGDLNGDGLPDLLATGNNGLSVFLADGQGGFPLVYQNAQITGVFAVADFNGDGHLDVVTTRNLYPGNGDGTFGAPIPLPGGPYSWLLATADFNGDGSLDLALSDGAAHILLGDGHGAFAVAGSYSDAMGAIQYGASADFNGDGHTDLAVFSSHSFSPPSQVLVLLGDGAGGLTLGTSMSNPTSFGVPLVATDVDGDGITDLVVGGALSVFPGLGGGAFGPPRYFNASAGSLAVADFTGDGRPDVAIATFQNVGIAVAVNDGAGGFSASPAFSIPDQPSDAGTGRFHAGGHADLVIASADGSALYLYPGLGDGQFGAPDTVVGASTPTALTIADFNNDGHDDVAVSSGSGVAVLLGDGNGHLGPPQQFSAGTGGVASGDLNGDGNIDLVTTGAQEVDVLLGDGTGNFAAAVAVPLPGFPTGSVVLADMNGDGHLDIVVPAGYVYVLLGNGDGTFGSPIVTTSVSAWQLVVGDWNGDGHLDLAVASVGGESISILLGDGGGQFGPPSSVLVGGGGFTPFLRSADFNGDGHADLAVNSPGLGEVAVLLGDGTGTFSSSSRWDAETYCTLSVVADWNEDGRPDIAAVGPPRASILLNTGCLPRRLGIATNVSTCNASGVAFPVQPAVGVYDDGGNVVTCDSSDIAASLVPGHGSSGAVLGGTASVAAVSGVATYSDLSVDLDGSGYLLQFSHPAAGVTRSRPFTVGGAPSSPAASNSGPFCQGQTVFLYATSVRGAVYRWTGPNGFSSTVQSPLIPNAPPEAAGTYAVTAVVDGCTSAASPTTVSALAPSAGPTIVGYSTVCSGSRLLLRVPDGAFAYHWFQNGTPIPGAVDPLYTVPSASDADAGTYTVSTSDATGCTSALSTPVVVTVSFCYAEAQALAVDPAGNGILEPGEAAVVDPSWLNRNIVPLTLAGSVSNFTGPAGATYAISAAAAGYGTIAPKASANCLIATGQCYSVMASFAGSRPTTHWDAYLDETLDDSDPPRTWILHIGQSFTDVTSTSPVYPFVERILHNGITAGCAPTTYCPSAGVSRAQMAVLLLRARHGAGYVPPPATGQVFTDVPADAFAAAWIEELAYEEITAGCGGGAYCPTAIVNRSQMAVFLLRAKWGPGFGVPACTSVFADVPCPGPFTDWIEELFHESITGGCGANPLVYCPDNPNTRGQMAVFLVKTFGLQLYGP